MGISCDFETGSMESEIKPTCNKEFIKLNGQHELIATTAISAETEVITIDDSKSDVVVDLASPTPPETETIVIDDAEPEEGEIIASDDDFEYEAISSEEELSLRQQIEALEAKNRELEKIASISTRGIEYGYRRSPNFNNYKTLKNHTKQNPPLSSVTSYKTTSLSHVENISSDEAQLVDSENEFANLLDSIKSHNRSHRTSKKEKRQSRTRKPRIIDSDKERCIAHGKRRCIDINCYPIDVTVARKRRARHKYDDRKTARTKYSSESEDELLGKRAELKMALNIIEPSNRSVFSSTLSHKLSAIQNQQALDESKKSFNKHRKRKNSKSPERVKRRRRSSENGSKRTKDEHRNKSRTNNASPIMPQDTNDNEIHDDDEAIVLEEQELRLIALKSAVLKKHEARKKKLANQMNEHIVRPYSPTDSVVLVTDEIGERSNDCMDSDNNNMDISPISSPGNQYQPMDMELASSNENSNSPIFSYEKPQAFPPYEPFIDWAAVTIPLPINPTFVDIDQSAALNQQFAMQTQFSLMYDQIPKEPMEPSPVPAAIQPELKQNDVNDEEELRAQLIEQIRNPNTNGVIDLKIESTEKIVPKEINVDSLEEDCLRSLLLSSKGKKSIAFKETTSKPATSSIKIDSSNQAKCDEMPKLGGVLREALNRLKNKQQSKLIECENGAENVLDKCGDSMRDCDQSVIQKTVVNNQLDKNKNELFNSDTTSFVPVKSAKDMEPLKEIDENVRMKLIEEKLSTKPAEDIKIPEELKPIVEQTIVIPSPNETIKSVEALESISRVDEVKKILDISASTSVAKSVVKPAGIVDVNQTTTNANTIAKPKPKVPANQKVQSIKPSVPKVNAIVTTTTTALASTLNKMESIRKTTGSPVIQNWTPKPIKKVIVTLNPDSSDNDDLDCDSKSTQSSNRYDSGSPSNDSSNAFQHRLDQFLQTVRANTDTVQEIKQPPTTAVTIKTSTKVVTNSAQKTQATSKIESSKAVSHLPMSSQLEYHRLLNRMKLLEKQKEQKSRLAKEQSSLKQLPLKNETNFPKLTVVVQNENRFIQTNKTIETEGDKSPLDANKSLIANKISTSKLPTSTNNTSLAKKVLVKNAMDCLVSAKVTDEPNLDSSISTPISVAIPVITVPVQVLSSVQCVEQSTSSVNETIKTTESKSTSMSLAIFAKKTPKVRASMLANYVKRFKSHGQQYLDGLTNLHRLTCRTNFEVKKEKKLEEALDELKRKTKIVEEQLKQQKLLTKSLHPTILATEKTVTSDRTMLLKLQNCCNQLGKIDNGPDYKVQCDSEANIEDTIRKISFEKKKLKLLVPKLLIPQASKEIPKAVQVVKSDVTSDKLSQSIPKPTKNLTDIDIVKAPTTQQHKETDSIVNSIEIENNAVEEIQNKSVEVLNQLEDKTTQNEPVKMDIDLESNEITENSHKETQSPQIIITQPETNEIQKEEMHETKAPLNNELFKPDDMEAVQKIDVNTSSTDNLTEQITDGCNTDSDAICGKYDSPLDHMQSCTEDKPNFSVEDRNAIVCPYDLMGRCEDKLCKYKHLSV